MATISASDANRHFSTLLREVAEGQTFTVLSRGRPVATIAPVTESTPERAAARRGLFERLRSQKPLGTRNWAREELYER